MRYPSHLSLLIEHLKKLPSVGQKSAERFAFQVLEWPEQHLKAFAEVLTKIPQELQTCAICGALKDGNQCLFCDNSNRDFSLLCVVSQPRDIFFIEETQSYKGLYHVLGGLLSPLLNEPNEWILSLKERLSRGSFKELILALDSTIEGDATTLFLKNELPLEGLTLSRLAFGMPVGSSLDYIDGNTLSKAFIGRSGF